MDFELAEQNEAEKRVQIGVLIKSALSICRLCVQTMSLKSTPYQDNHLKCLEEVRTQVKEGDRKMKGQLAVYFPFLEKFLINEIISYYFPAFKNIKMKKKYFSR